MSVSGLSFEVTQNLTSGRIPGRQIAKIELGRRVLSLPYLLQCLSGERLIPYFQTSNTSTQSAKHNCIPVGKQFSVKFLFYSGTWLSYLTDLLSLRLVDVIGARSYVRSSFSRLTGACCDLDSQLQARCF